MSRFLCLIVFLQITVLGISQDIEQILKTDKKNIVKISGGMNYSTTVFQSDNPLNTRDPFAWFASGNINFSILNFAFPFSYSISNQNKSFSQPSNITALHPAYKWVKTHVGRTSMSFSPYTLTGVNFSGVGLELTPKKFQFQAMYGLLSKAVQYNAAEDNVNTIAYKRMAYSMMFNYKLKGVDFKIIVLKASDDKNSLVFAPGESSVKPKDNLVTSFSVKSKVFNVFDFDTEYASSIMNNNTINMIGVSDTRWFTFLYPIVRGNSSTTNYNAFKSSLNYTVKAIKLGFSYERVDPNYQTLGGLYFTNDMENFTFNPSFSLFKNKVTLSSSTGLQRNDLAQDKVSKTKRWVGSLNLSMQLFKGFNSTFSYSNFSSFTRNNPLNDPFTSQVVFVDTLNVYQVSENFVSSLSYSFGKKNKTSLNTSFTYSKSANITGKLENAAAFGINANGTTNPFHVYSNTFGYNYTMKDQNLTVGLNLNSNLSKSELMNSWFCGPSLNVSKSFGKQKPNLAGGITYNRNYMNNVLTNNMFNYRCTVSHAPKLKNEKWGKINLALNLMFLNKLPTANELKKLHELTIIANVGYTF